VIIGRPITERLFSMHGRQPLHRKDYGNFEMLVDWKIPPRGDSGIYVRGSPQVQIWSRKAPANLIRWTGQAVCIIMRRIPTSADFADHPVGEWNRFRIVMVGEKSACISQWRISRSGYDLGTIGNETNRYIRPARLNCKITAAAVFKNIYIAS